MRWTLLLCLTLPVAANKGPKGKAGCGKWENPPQGSFTNTSEEGVGFVCDFGHEPTDHKETSAGLPKCSSAQEREGTNWFTCVCLTKEQNTVAWQAYQASMIAIGVIVGGVGLILLLPLCCLWRRISDCIDSCTKRAEADDPRKGCCMFAIVLLPVGMVVTGIVFCIIGAAADMDGYWDAGCTRTYFGSGSPQEDD